MEHQEEIQTPKKQAFGIPSAIITGFAIVALAIIFTNSNNKPQTQAPETKTSEMPTEVSKEIATVRATDHVTGNPNADIAIITYSDSDCPYCEKFHTTMETTLSENKDIAWVYRHLPLDIHPNAFNEAVSLECAATLGGNQAFWGYLNSIINVTLDPEDAETPTKLLAFAAKQGISEEAFKSCYSADTNPGIEKISNEIAEIAEAGARGTPFSIAVNVKTGNQIVIPGAAPIESVREIIKALK